MPFYQKQGQFPHKRHTQFRKENGSLFHEELFGTIGLTVCRHCYIMFIHQRWSKKSGLVKV